MSATEELRRMLDERGADYRVSATGYSIDIGPYTTAYANRSDTTLDVSLRQVTPEQAIAATLGDVPRLPHFWTHDGTLHVELPKLPETISVRLPAQRDREVGSARVWQYTRDDLQRANAENAKLRELVLYMWDFSCVVPDEPHTSKEELDYSVEVWKRMRELGVEVDE